ncbi:MAG: sensor domain-containing diguanylate cyclase [Ruminococcus sp.]|nr:sensor domain-containing diguanylate cyclase [Ruminococcus sp.]
MDKKTRRIISTLAVVAVIILLTVFMVIRTSDKTRENAISHMKSIAQEQSVMIKNYVDNAEQTLNAFRTASEVENVLKNPDNVGISASAQKYTEDFSATVSDPEGIWIGDWKTHVLTHTNSGVVGITTRTDPDSLKQLQDSMLNAPDNLYNAGIIISPASGKQILSMYKAVIIDGNPEGLVGFGIFTENLASALNTMEFNTAGTTFSMVNVKDKKYIFCDNPEMVGEETTDADIIDICNQYADTSESITGSFEGKKDISFYSYMGDTGWLLVVTSPSSEVFEFSRSININIISFCTVCIILMIIFNVISIKQEQTLQKLEASKKKQASITKNLHLATLKDILTDVNNRISFINDFSKDKDGNPKVADCPETPYCFAMFNISKFSQVNITYGHDIGDMVLATTADILKKHFDAESIYRTGSDEFVVAVQSPNMNTSGFQLQVNHALAELQSPREIGNIRLTLFYSSAIVKKGVSISPAVLITLKDLINKNGSAINNSATFLDMDFA